MGDIVPFRPRKREEDAYLLKVVYSSVNLLPHSEKGLFTKLALAMYDDDRVAFDTFVDQLFNKREDFVSSVLAWHTTYKKEAEEAGNEYTHTLRPPRGYEWVPIEKD